MVTFSPDVSDDRGDYSSAVEILEDLYSRKIELNFITSSPIEIEFIELRFGDIFIASGGDFFDNIAFDAYMMTSTGYGHCGKGGCSAIHMIVTPSGIRDIKLNKIYTFLDRGEG